MASLAGRGKTVDYSYDETDGAGLPVFVTRLLLLFTAGLTVAMVYGEQGEVTFANRSSGAIYVFSGPEADDLRFEMTLDANSSLDAADAEKTWWEHFLFQTAAGRVLFEGEITWDDAKDHDFEIVIDEEGLWPDDP